MLRERLTARLKKEHRATGLYLEEDEDFLYLKRGDDELARWLATKARMPRVLDEADRLMKTE